MTQPGRLTDACHTLPDPVGRYLQHALAEVASPIRSARLVQRGTLRSDVSRERWMPFEAVHEADPVATCFRWDARVRVAPLIHLRVQDSYADGIGAGRVRLLSQLTLASDRNTPELNAAALHRFLAESVWYPSALLPGFGVQWRAIDARRGLASLSDAGNVVSLEFRFNAADEVESVYTPGRYQRVGKTYVHTPWEGHFADYIRQDGMCVPRRGEVGWYRDGQLGMVWRGAITRFDFTFEQGCSCSEHGPSSPP